MAADLQRMMTLRAEFEAAREVEVTARKTLAVFLQELLRKVIPVGTLIDVDARQKAEWLVNVKVGTGHPRGARVYEVASPIRVSGDHTHPELWVWRADAYPINAAGKRLAGPDPALRIIGPICVGTLKGNEDDFARAVARMVELAQAPR